MLEDPPSTATDEPRSNRRIERVLPLTFATLGFAYGLGFMLMAGKESSQHFESLIGGSVWVRVLVAIGTCVISVAFWYILACSFARGSWLMRQAGRAIISSVLGIGLGFFAAVLLGTTGLADLPFRWSLIVGAFNWMMGGLAGLRALSAA